MSENVCPVCGCDEPRPVEDALRREVARLTAELETVKANRDDFATMYSNTDEKAGRLSAENRALCEALKFYSIETNYSTYGPRGQHPIDMDHGKRAKQAIAEYRRAAPPEGEAK